MEFSPAHSHRELTNGNVERSKGNAPQLPKSTYIHIVVYFPALIVVTIHPVCTAEHDTNGIAGIPAIRPSAVLVFGRSLYTGGT